MIAIRLDLPMASISRRTALAALLTTAPMLLAGCDLGRTAITPGAASATPSGVKTGSPAASPAVASVGSLGSGEFGPTGKHWPSRTPAPTDTFDFTVEVNPTWAAIADGIKQAIARAPKGKTRVLVKPGVLPGFGAGSSKPPVLKGVGKTGLPYRVLVMPRDGVGTVTFADSLRFDLVAGVSFVGFWLFPNSMVLSGVQDFAWAWSKGQAFNISSNSAVVTSDVELVECVTADARLIDADTWAFRTGGQPYINVSVVGCYLAPSYKAAGSSAHCDTLQLSGNEAKTGLVFRDTVIFSSTNAGFIPSGGADDVLFDHCLFVGGDRMLVRYPLPAGANAFTSGYPAAINGVGSVDVMSATNSTFIGNVRGTFKSVQNTKVSATKPPAATSGSFTSDPSLSSIDAAWLESRSPMPSDDRLRAAWAAV